MTHIERDSLSVEHFRRTSMSASKFRGWVLPKLPLPIRLLNSVAADSMFLQDDGCNWSYIDVLNSKTKKSFVESALKCGGGICQWLGVKAIQQWLPEGAEACNVILCNLQNAGELFACEKGSVWWETGWKTVSHNLRKAHAKVSDRPFGGPVVMNYVRGMLNSASKIMLSLVLFGSTVPAVGAMAPEAAAAQGTSQAGNFENSSNFAFGVVASIGVLFTIFGVLYAIKWRNCRSKNLAIRALGSEYTFWQLRTTKTCLEEVVVAIHAHQ